MSRLVDALVHLPYRGIRRIVLIDDGSTDESPALMTEAATRHADLQAVLLTGRQRGKADALRDGLASAAIAPEDLVLVIDADHRLREDALDNLANYFDDPAIYAVAIEHPVDRPGRSLVSAYCYLEAAVSEAVTSRGQHALGLPTKLAGSWACRADVFNHFYPAGWHLTDDTVFTARIIAAGGQVCYAADVVALQDVPDTIGGYWSQHLRWSAGYAESAGKALSARAGREGLLQHFDAIVTHAGYFERPLLALLGLVAAVGWFAAGTMMPALVLVGIVAFYIMTILVQVFAALFLSGANARLAVMSFASLPLLAVDMLISIRGVIAGMVGQRVVWKTDHRG